MKITQILFALSFSAVVSAECGASFTYCSGNACKCSADGINDWLINKCIADGYKSTTGPSAVYGENMSVQLSM
ncbi:unnamed protein product [Diplocarpon coronariae]